LSPCLPLSLSPSPPITPPPYRADSHEPLTRTAPPEIWQKRFPPWMHPPIRLRPCASLRLRQLLQPGPFARAETAQRATKGQNGESKTPLPPSPPRERVG
jgi:hypothetical protein